MFAAATLRARIEASLANRIPGALTPVPRIVREFVATGIPAIDELLCGGFPANAITEVVGDECAGRTSLALSFVASLTQAGKVCGWIDVSDALHSESAAAAGVDLERLLWVRCQDAAPKTGISTISHRAVSFGSPSISTIALPGKYFVPRRVKQGLHGGGFGPHPRDEVKGLSSAIGGLFGKGDSIASHMASQQKVEKKQLTSSGPAHLSHNNTYAPKKNWTRLEQALRTADLLLHNGGFAALVLDMGSIAQAQVLRVPLATWFRYRAVAEQKQTSVVLLLQHPCAKSSAALTLRLHAVNPRIESTVFAGLDLIAEVERQRFLSDPGDIVKFRKPPQTQRWTRWRSHAPWTRR